jgi:hypothetical protein
VLPGMDRRWIAMMRDLLREGADDDDFDLEPHKSFYWDENAQGLRYVWVLLVWGDLEGAQQILGPILERAFNAPAPAKPKKPAPPPPVKKSNLVVQERYTADGSRVTRTLAPIPHAKAGRYGGDPHEVIGLESPKKFKAVAQGRGEAGFAPRKAEEI